MAKSLVTLVLLLFIFQSKAQESTVSDSANLYEPTNLLMLSISYTSNNMKTKNYEYDRIPALLMDIHYFNKKGFTGVINYANYYNALQNTYEAEFQIGYQKELLTDFTISSHYTRRAFVGDTTYEGLAQKNTLDLALAYSWKFIDFEASNSYLNGKSNNYFLDLDLGLSFDIDHLLFKNDFLLINPTISATFGTDYWVYQNLKPKFERAVINYLSNHGFKSQRFEYQNISVFIPVVYSVGNVGFMFNWFYSWPSAKLAQLSWKDQTGVLFSVFFTPNS
ncbi:MAG: hypothetical protein JW857_07840 [Bacteroidales bacterium]|nr:hypothetical protein [Bacteroidales bacterium]